MSPEHTPSPRILQNPLLCGIAILLLAGCTVPQLPDQKALRLLGPRSIEIHDSSAIVQTSTGGDFDGLSVRCEVKDSFGDSIKTVGVMRFELYTFIPSQPFNKGQRVAFWQDLRIDSVETIREHWDSTLSLYRFDLNWDKQVKPKQRFVLEAVLTTGQGQQFTDNHTLEVSP